MSAKILYFIETGGAGGAERVVLDLAAGMAANDYQVGVCTLRSGWFTEQLKEKGIPHFLLPSNGFDPFLPFTIAQLIHAHGFHVLHSHLLDSNFYGALAARLAGCRHVATEHGDVHHLQPKNFIRAKLRLASLCGARFTAVSRFTGERMASFGVSRDRITIIGNPIPPKPASNREEVRRELGIEQQEWAWAHVANLRKVKDQTTLIRGFAGSLRHSSVPQRLLVIGDGPEREELVTLSRVLGVAERVSFLGFRNDVGRLLTGADGFILSSVSEALPMSLLEAGQCGLLLVTSAVGGLPEIVRSGETGFLFPAGDHCALSMTLAEALSDVRSSLRLATKARREIEARFGLQKVLEQYSALYFD